jgi:hypothetical protein
MSTNFPVALPVLAALNTGGKKIATSGTQVQLSASSVVLTNGLYVKALFSNTAAISVGLTGVTNTVDGSGNGFILGPGEGQFFPVNNLNLLFCNGTSGDACTFEGN